MTLVFTKMLNLNFHPVHIEFLGDHILVGDIMRSVNLIRFQAQAAKGFVSTSGFSATSKFEFVN